MLNATLTHLLHLLPSETAHRLALSLLPLGTNMISAKTGDPILATELCGIKIPSAIGLAAGFDKDGIAIDALLKMGFGFVEAGTVTPLPQIGNPKPRLFRLAQDKAIINRMGFNNAGASAMAARLSARQNAKNAVPGIVGVNLGKNKDSDSAVSDYERGAARFARLADYIVLNVSSPNTPGLRALQSKKDLGEITKAVKLALQNAIEIDERIDQPIPPLFVKIAPDITEEDALAIAELAAGDNLIDGLIITNTTIERPDSLKSKAKTETGGLSGAPVFEKSTQWLRHFYTLTHGQVPLIGVGGIMSAKDAYAKIRSGASAIQIYTGFVYGGPDFLYQVQEDLASLIKADGFHHISEAVGVDVA